MDITWNVARLLGADDKLTIVEATATFSDSGYAGVESIGSFQTDISSAQLSKDAELAAISAAIIDSLGANWSDLLAFHAEQLAWKHAVEQANLYSSPTPAMVNIERDRRVQKTFKFNDVLFQLDSIAEDRITAMGADARFAVLNGAQPGDYFWADPSIPFGFIATDNTTVPMDAQTMVAFSEAAKRWIIHHTFRAREIKDMNPIPSDFADDSYWEFPEEPEEE